MCVLLVNPVDILLASLATDRRLNLHVVRVVIHRRDHRVNLRCVLLVSRPMHLRRNLVVVLVVNQAHDQVVSRRRSHQVDQRGSLHRTHRLNHLDIRADSQPADRPLNHLVVRAISRRRILLVNLPDNLQMSVQIHQRRNHRHVRADNLR